MSCAYKILILIWPRTRKFSQFLQVGKAVTFDSPWSRVGYALCPHPLFVFWLVKIWQVSSCGKFMQHLETCLLIAEVDRGLWHLVMFLTVFLHWMYKMKYSCMQDSCYSCLDCLLGFWLRNVPLVKVMGNLISYGIVFTCFVRGLKSWPYLMALRSCSISTGLSINFIRSLLLFCFVFFFWFYEVERRLCGYALL